MIWKTLCKQTLSNSRNGDTKIMLSIRIKKTTFTRIRKNQCSQFRWTISKTLTGQTSMIGQGFQRTSIYRTGSPKHLLMHLIRHINVAIRSTSPKITAALHAPSNGRFTKTNHIFRRKKPHKSILVIEQWKKPSSI